MKQWELPRVLCGSLLTAAVSGCSPPPEHAAEVKLTIDGTAFEYRTTKAQVDRQERGGPYSVYLLPDQADGRVPYLCLRAYSGNPVAELWVRYTPPARARANPSADLDKYDCFVPGVLSDGRPTLGWTRDDGRPRDRTETGEQDCRASVRQEGSSLRLEVDAVLQRKAPAEKKSAPNAASSAAPADRIAVGATAVIHLDR